MMSHTVSACAAGSLEVTQSTSRALAPAPPPDWAAILRGLEASDPDCVGQISGLVTRLLARHGAFDLGDSWEDLRHEILIAFIVSVRERRIREPDACVSYLGTMTRRTLSTWIAKRRRAPRPRSEDDLADVMDANDVGRMPSRATDPEVLLDVDRALAALDPRERQIIDAVYLAGHDYADAAERLGMPLGTLKHLRTRALETLRERMHVRRPRSAVAMRARRSR